MFDKSIAYRLSVLISLAVISVFIAFIIITFIFNNTLVTSNIESQSKTVSSKVILDVDRQIITTQEVSQNIADQVLYYAKNADLYLLLKMVMNKYPFLNAIHVDIDSTLVGLKSHNYFILSDSDTLYFERQNGEIYGCRIEKRIHEEAKSKETPTWSEVFNCKKNNTPVVSYYTPIYNGDNQPEKQIVGSVICELSLKTLNDSINKIKIGERGYSFLVNENGTYLTHPDESSIFTKNLKDLPERTFGGKKVDLNNFLSNKISGTSFVYPEFLNYERTWVSYTPLQTTGWTLLVLVPQTELYKPFYLMILRMLFFSVLGILVIFYIVTYITNRLIRPLSTVTTQLKKFSSLSGEIGNNTLDEIKMVSESLDYMKIWYEKFRINQKEEEKLNYHRRQDLLDASEIQMSLINTDFSLFENRSDLDLYAIYKPARIVSGDLFDFFFIDKENLFFSIGDVSGKGVSAAFFMSVAQTVIKNNANARRPGEIVSKVNNVLYTTNHHQFFLTLFIGILNVKNGKLTYCNAAHTSTLILNMKGEITELGLSHGLPLGLYPEKIYKDTSIILNPGDNIMLYTDGVVEIQNEQKEIFGTERLYKLLQSLSNFAPRNLVTHLDTDLDTYKGDAKQVDDITVMVIKYFGNKK